MNIVLISPCRMDGGKGSSVLMRNLFLGEEPHSFLSLYTQDEPPSMGLPSLETYRLPARPRRSATAVVENTVNYARGKSESIDGILQFRPTAALEAALDAFEPDVVYSQLGPPWLMKLTAWIARRYPIALIIHVMDDFLIDWPVSGDSQRRWMPALSWLNDQANAAFADLLTISSTNFCISSDMADVYTRRYGRPFSSLPNPVDHAQWSRDSNLDMNRRQLRIGFVGSIQEKVNAEALQAFGELLDTCQHNTISARLSIVSQNVSAEQRASLGLRSSITFIDTLPHERIPSFLAQCDLLLMPINFNAASVAFCQLSWPTKLSEYLSSGTPVLYFGPATVGFARTLAEQGLARIITRGDAALLVESLESYAQWAPGVSSRSQAFVRRTLDSTQIRLRMNATLEKSCTDV